ncbi:enoyl-CoA hydratase/isomerase family protein [Kerstersia gyiorum]|uniref:enoyl-CoA hydratase/isomerase family protein n=1 Tax=Kerstersia gyiorum TaxID=206506 RepID=UPI003B4333AF
MSQELVLTRIHAGIAEIRLNRPNRHNALVPALLDALLKALDDVRADEPRAVVLAAQGRSFSSGGDVAGFSSVPRPERRAYARHVVGALNEVILTLLQLPCPTIAAVQGLVTGGSAGLVLACDLAVGGPDTSFAPWYTAVGFSPDGGWTTLMPERIGRARALSVQLLNERLEAPEAARLGLLHQLAPDTDSVLPLAHQIATRMAAGRPGSVRHTLEQVRPDPQTVAAGLARELQHFLEQIDTDEAARGMQEFLGLKRR